MRLVSTIRIAVRSLARRRAYAAIVIAILGVSIGATTAVFGVVDAVLLRSLPYAHPESLVVVFADGSSRGQGAHVATTPGDFVDWQAQAAGVFDGLAALRNVSPRITSLDTPVVPLTHAVSANYFDVLGATPLLGRAFLRGEDAPGREDVVMMSYGLWQAKFGGDPSIVGRTIDLDGRPHTVVGVMGQDFYTAHIFNVQPDLWIPSAFLSTRDDRTTRDVLVYGRLRGDQTVTAAQAAMRTIARRLARAHPDTDDRWSVALVPIREHVVGAFERIAALVAFAVGIVLLIACANVANLMLARGTERTAEMAVRSALGATGPRIVTELLIESGILAACGGVIGVVVATVVMPGLVHLIPTSAGVPFLHRAAVDVRVLAFTIGVSLACALIAGLLPARHASRLDVIGALRSAGRGSIAPGRQWRAALVVAEVALAVVVIACAALMTRTLLALDRVQPGFDAARIAELRTSLRGEAFAAPASRVAHYEELQRRLAAVPGVGAASGVSFEPPDPAGRVAAVRLRLPGRSDDAAAAPSAVSRVVLADYFQVMGIPILNGRGIDGRDRADAQRVVVISQAFAARYFGDIDPIGRSFSLDAPHASPMQIVGVAGDVVTAGTDPAPQPTFYMAHAQNAVGVMTMVMRVPQGRPAAVLAAAERIAWSLSPFTNVYAVQTMEERLAELTWRERFSATVLGGFATLGLLLAAAGLYAIVSYTVIQRRREIGLRMALGANARAIVREVMAGGLRTVLVGLVIGNLAAVAASRGLAGMLYGVAPGDPATLAMVSMALLGIAACACGLPALAASRVDPRSAMSDER